MRKFPQQNMTLSERLAMHVQQHGSILRCVGQIPHQSMFLFKQQECTLLFLALIRLIISEPQLSL